MFRLHDNVPEVYVQQSRDFQLISRLYDTIISGVKYDIDTIVDILDAAKARDTMLLLMCTKIGFFTREDIDAQVLKYIVASFPYLLKYKGTEKGIELAVNTILKAENTANVYSKPLILIVNKSNNELYKDYTVYIYTTIDLYNRVALKELLKYVLPVGYNYQLHSYARITDGNMFTQFKQQDSATIYKTYVPKISTVRTNSANVSDDAKFKQYQSAYDVSEVVTNDMIKTYNDADVPTSTIYPLNSEES